MVNSRSVQYHCIVLRLYCIGHPCFASLLPDMAVQKLFIALVRGFPDRMLERIRQQPCTALLQTMLRRQSRASPADYLLGSVKVSTCTSRRDRPVTKHDCMFSAGRLHPQCAACEARDERRLARPPQQLLALSGSRGKRP